MTEYSELINTSTDRNYMMDKALFEEVLKMNREMTNQNRQIKEQKIQIQTLEEIFKVLQPKKSEQRRIWKKQQKYFIKFRNSKTS